MGGTKEDAEKKFQKARRKAKKAMQSVKKAIEDGGIAINHAHVGIRRWVDDMAGLKKLGMSVVIVLVAEATVQKTLLILNRYAQRLASVVEGYTAHLEGLSPTDHIALLILGTLIVATFLLSLQLRTIGYSLRRTNLYMEDLQLRSQGEPSARGQKTMTDGGDTESGEPDQGSPRETDADSDDKRGTSKVGAIGGAMAGGTYGAIFGMAGILAGIAIGAMFGQEIEKRISNRAVAPGQKIDPVENKS